MKGNGTRRSFMSILLHVMPLSSVFITFYDSKFVLFKREFEDIRRLICQTCVCFVKDFFEGYLLLVMCG